MRDIPNKTEFCLFCKHNSAFYLFFNFIYILRFKIMKKSFAAAVLLSLFAAACGNQSKTEQAVASAASAVKAEIIEAASKVDAAAASAINNADQMASNVKAEVKDNAHDMKMAASMAAADIKATASEVKADVKAMAHDVHTSASAASAPMAK